jgi:hypothetical protein
MYSFFNYQLIHDPKKLKEAFNKLISEGKEEEAMKLANSEYNPV